MRDFFEAKLIFGPSSYLLHEESIADTAMIAANPILKVVFIFVTVWVVLLFA